MGIFAPALTIPRKCGKQRTYGRAKSFRCNTYKKTRGEGALHSSSNRSRGTCQETQVLSLHAVAHSFALSKNQLFCFQAIPHSFAKTPGGGVSPCSVFPQPAFAPTYLVPQILPFQSNLNFSL